MKSKEYLVIKNVIHNELKIKKEDIQDLIKAAIQEETKIFLNRYIQSNPINTIIDKTVSIEINKLINNTGWNSNADKLMKYIGEQITKRLNIDVKL